MKKLCLYLVTAVCVLMLCACNSSSENCGETQDFSQRPSLNVVCREQSVEALKGTSTWTYTLGDGKKQTVCSDSLHPLQAKEFMTPLRLLPSTMSRLDPFGATLLFDYAMPDKVEIRAWSEDCFDNTSAESLEIEAEIYDENYVFTLLDGNYVYEIVAEWNTQSEFEGTVHYSFYTEKPELQMSETIPVDK